MQTIQTLPHLITLVSKIAEVSAGTVTPDTTPEQLAMDSLALVELTACAENDFGVLLETGELLAGQTVAEMAALIGAKRTVTAASDC